MAKLLSYYNLCPINNREEFLGLSPDMEPGSIINTLGRNIILVIQLNNQKQINSWTVIDRLSSKVVYDFHTKKYVGVFLHRFLRCWTEADNDINKIKRIKLIKPVHDMISFENKSTIVVYKDGSCESLESCLATRKDEKNWLNEAHAIVNEEKHNIRNISYFINSDETITLTYFIQNIVTKEIELIYYNLDLDNLRPTGAVVRIKVQRNIQDVKLVGSTVVLGTSEPQLITVWSDKRIFMLPINNNRSYNDGIGSFVSMLNIINVEQPLTMLGISKDCMAIYGANVGQEGSSIVLFNTQFNVIQSKQFFKVYFSKCDLWVIAKRILLAIGQQLAVVSFRITQELLSDMIGSQRNNDLHAFVDKDFINEECDLEQTLEYCCCTEEELFGRKSKLLKIDTKINNHKLNNNRLEDIESFNNDLRLLYMHNIRINVDRHEMLSENGIHVKVSVNPIDSISSIEEVHVLYTELEKLGASEIEITDRVIPILIKSNFKEELLVCLQRYTSLSEQSLIRVMKYVLLNTNDSEHCKLHLNIIFSCMFDEELVKPYLRRELNLDNGIFLLNYIYNLLKENITTLNLNVIYNDIFDEDRLLFKWFAVLLDSFYQHFSLSSDPNLLNNLQQWRELLQSFVIDIRSLKSIQSVLYKLVDGKNIGVDKQSTKWYTVEAAKLY